MAGPKWSVSDAKARLSDVLREATHRPQVIENRGQEIAVVLGIDEYRRLRAIQEKTAPRQRLAEFLRDTERLRNEGGAELELPRREPRPSPFSDDTGD